MGQVIATSAPPSFPEKSAFPDAITNLPYIKVDRSQILSSKSRMPDEISSQEQERWCAVQRDNVIAYLVSENCPSTSVGEWPAWYVAPMISIWAVESVKNPGWVGWWVVSGDFPTDYIECGGDRHPRQGLREIGLRWQEAAKRWQSGEEFDNWRLGDGAEHRQLAPLLAQSAGMFLEIAAADEHWVE